jgi:hypothetical protein
MNRVLFTAALMLSHLAAAAPVFETGFDAPDALAAWQGVRAPQIRLEKARDGSQTLRVEAQADGSSHASAQIVLPVEALRGCRVRVDALVKAEGVTAPPKPWTGIKVMLHSQSPDGDKWEQQNNIAGTFDWKPVRFIARVPETATKAELVLGLEAANGTAWFDEVKVTVVSAPRTRPAQAASGPVFKGHDMPRLRGAMISPNVTEAARCGRSLSGSATTARTSTSASSAPSAGLRTRAHSATCST